MTERAPHAPSAPGVATPLTTAPLTAEHWPAVRDIHAAGIATGASTFESSPPTWEDFDASHLADQRHVALDARGQVLGWSAASPVSSRCVYAGVVEGSVYVAPSAHGRGVGRLLLDTLVDSTEAVGIWTIQAGVFTENTASLALHAAAGFRVVGVRERIGVMTHGPHAGRWLDVVLLERRSPRI